MNGDESIVHSSVQGLLPMCVTSHQDLLSLLANASVWYWQQDANFKFTHILGEAAADIVYLQKNIGKSRWESSAVPVTDKGSWEPHRAVLERHEPFKDFIYRQVGSDRCLRFISASGEPIFSDNGEFLGYRGLAKDVTSQYLVGLWRDIEHQITRALESSTDISESGSQIIRIICESLGWAIGLLWVTDPQGRTLCCLKSWGNDSPYVAEFIEASMRISREGLKKTSFIYRAYEKAEIEWIVNILDYPNYLRSREAKNAKLQSAFVFPIKISNQVTSIFEFYSHSMQELDAPIIEAVDHISRQIGQFYQRVNAENEVYKMLERFKHLTELSSDWIWELDEFFRYRYDSSCTRDYLPGLRFDDSLGKAPWELPYKKLTSAEWEAHKKVLMAHEHFSDWIFQQVTTSGSMRTIAVSGMPFFARDGKFLGYRGIGRDITDQRQAEEKIKYLATHDVLTALPNRALFSEMLNHTILSARRYHKKFAVLFIDLDRFKIINDTLGHDSGDKLLLEMSQRLSHLLRESDLVARLGGDEFVVLLQEVENQQTVAQIASKILSSLIRPVILFGQECRVTASVGIAMYPAHGQDEQTLMKNADLAMYRAKEDGRNNYQFFSNAIQTQSLERLSLETSLRQALERNEFFLHYQAKQDLKAGKITGVEALLRWQHPELGVVSPLKFIPLAEETGLIVPIGKWVLREACRQNVAWQEVGLVPVCIAINLSARQFADEHLLEDIQNVLSETGMSAELLELELTESMVIQSPEKAVGLLSKIKELGVRLAIDDFGTGYSSLAQLKQFPVDTLKVDRSFIRDIPHNKEDNAITEAIIAMGKVLSLTVIAEGVETQDQEAFLRHHACDEIQGYYFSKPASAGDFEIFLRDHMRAIEETQSIT